MHFPHIRASLKLLVVLSHHADCQPSLFIRDLRLHPNDCPSAVVFVLRTALLSLNGSYQQPFSQLSMLKRGFIFVLSFRETTDSQMTYTALWTTNYSSSFGGRPAITGGCQGDLMIKSAKMDGSQVSYHLCGGKHAFILFLRLLMMVVQINFECLWIQRGMEFRERAGRQVHLDVSVPLLL